MATFAELDANYIVLGLYKVRDEECGGGNFPESEPVGIEYLNNLFGPGRIWKQCSVHGNFRKNAPRVGEVYDETLDAFIPKQPYPSWILKMPDCQWGAPVPYPEDGRFPNPTKEYRWDESTVSWAEVGPYIPPPSPSPSPPQA